MAEVKILGNAVVVTSTMKLDDLRTIAKYRPDALILKGGEDGKEPIFGICVTVGDGGLTPNGAMFASESHDDKKLATITLHAEFKEDENVCEAVAEDLGSALNKLNKLEETLPAVLEEIKAEKAAVMESITVA